MKTKTSIYATFCISVNHVKGEMDENAIKAILQAGQKALANETMCLNSVVPLSGGEEEIPDSVGVVVTRLDIEGKPVNLRKFGTDDVKLDLWCQTEYHF